MASNRNWPMSRSTNQAGTVSGLDGCNRRHTQSSPTRLYSQLGSNRNSVPRWPNQVTGPGGVIDLGVVAFRRHAQSSLASNRKMARCKMASNRNPVYRCRNQLTELGSNPQACAIQSGFEPQKPRVAKWLRIVIGQCRDQRTKPESVSGFDAVATQGTNNPARRSSIPNWVRIVIQLPRCPNRLTGPAATRRQRNGDWVRTARPRAAKWIRIIIGQCRDQRTRPESVSGLDGCKPKAHTIQPDEALFPIGFESQNRELQNGFES